MDRQTKKSTTMEIAKWILARCNESFLYTVLFWIGIGYINTFIMRFLLLVPCRFNGDEFEQSNFRNMLLVGPLGLLAIPVVLIEAIYFFKKTTLPYLREQKRIAKMKSAKEKEKADHLFIISNGQFIVSKCIPMKRHKNHLDQSIKYFHQSKLKKNYDVKI